ncbi:MAG TPA: transglycosylase SLT domain-containing protein [Steroidobacteraceae bacterium]|nr:transglycosylase SLT domain-containing protein [Steroidobacteraceae bacterium]
MLVCRLAGLLLLGALPWAPAWADRQMDPELRGVIAAVIEPTRCFDDKYERAVWFATMEPRLQRYVADAKEREQILHNVHCESRRVGIPPELVLAVMDVESRFDRFAVSSAGAVGLMQVMPFWPKQLGMTNDQLVRVADNVRMGTTILGYYLRKERGDYQRALQRYNGRLGRPTYSDLVLDRFVARWRVAQ